MRLERLTLQNFRGFASLELSLDPSFTLLLGGNMAGKTAVLDAAAIVLSGFFDGTEHGARLIIEPSDVRRIVHVIGDLPDFQPQLPSIVWTSARFGAGGASWKRTTSESLQTPHPLALFQDLLKRVQNGDVVELPLIATYSVQRNWRAGASLDQSRLGNRLDGYAGCFMTESSQATLTAWMRKQTLVQLQRGGGYVHPQLAAVTSAITSCVDGIKRIWFDVQYEELRLERSDDMQSFSMLSEGYRNMVAMVADIAWRASVLNPQHGVDASKLTEGVVLIDELDLHLHPAWQRRVVGDLQRTFPKIQFIVTTHSPQIVASVKREQVRVLKNNELVTEPVFVEGRDSNGVLEDVFNVPARPPDAQAEIDNVFRLLDDEDFEAARRVLADLRTRLGPDDAAVVRAEWVLDTEAPLPPS